MTVVRYTGLGDAIAAFDALRPLHARLLAMQSRLRPFGSDYLVIEAVLKALGTAAYHFTREPDFFSIQASGRSAGAAGSSDN
jgi:hypothetical protein